MDGDGDNKGVDDDLDPLAIDAFWLQRQMNKFYDDAVVCFWLLPFCVAAHLGVCVFLAVLRSQQFSDGIASQAPVMCPLLEVC